MTRNGIYRLFVFTAAFAAISQAPANAKDPELAFFPAKAWTLGEAPMTSEVSTGGTQVCSIQSEFNNGFIIKLAGTERWIETMVIDFRQDAFPENSSYKPTLSVPGIATKTLPAQASKANVLVIDFKGQKDLYHAMRDSAVFDMKLQDNLFRFYMTGFASAAKGFERCMAGGGVQAPQDAQMQSASVNTINESIALEEKEASGAPVLEIRPENPQPVVQPVPYKETKKLGDMPVETDESFEQAEKRYSEKLAEQIAENPEIAAIDAEATPMPEAKANAPAPVAPSPEQVSSTPPTEPAAVPASKPEQPASQYTVAQQERARAMAAAQLEPPPELSQPPVLDGTSVMASESAPEVIENPVSAPPSNDTKTTALLNELAEPVKPVTMAPVTDAVITPEPAPINDIAKAPPATAASTPAPASTARRVEIPASPPVKVHREVAKMDADFTNLDSMEPASAPDAAAARSPRDPDMARKIAEMERAMGDLKRENASLSDELKMALKESEDERLNISSENWNLERATMRFNEAERQIRSLGDQIRKERAQCEMEKVDLQAQLFDPQITSQQQLARLAELEQQLAAAQAELDALRARSSAVIQ